MREGILISSFGRTLSVNSAGRSTIFKTSGPPNSSIWIARIASGQASLARL